VSELWTAEEVAERLRLNIATVYRLARRGDLVAVRIGTRRLFDPKDVAAFIERSKKEQVRA
jgi:excisionase family DNA binding protein